MGKRKPSKPSTEVDSQPSGPRIYQLRITLDGIDPPIYRRVQVNDHSLSGLHDLIQTVMGWENDHLHCFKVGKTRGGDYYGAEPQEARWARRTCLHHLVADRVKKFTYWYDFGDDWYHTIQIEKVLEPEPGVCYPRCIEGARACPPEDCGGIYGYMDLLDWHAQRAEQTATEGQADDEDEEEDLEQDEEAEREDEDEDEDDEDEDEDEWEDEEEERWQIEPEQFDLDAVNKHLVYLRTWLGAQSPAADVRPNWSAGTRVRGRSGLMHPLYPDIPIGGWVGEVVSVAAVSPPAYKVRWDADTLKQVHEVYFRRCKRDKCHAEVCWIDEPLLESTTEPVGQIEQPTAIVTRPLSPDDEEDRLRAVFGLTSDDRVPSPSDDTLRTFYEYLQGQVSLPVAARLWEENAGEISLSVVELLPSEKADEGIRVRAQGPDGERVAALAKLSFDELGPVPIALEDYHEWFWNCRNHDEASAEYEGEEDDDDDLDGVETLTPSRFPHAMAGPEETASSWREFMPERIEPITSHHTAGRNDPCPCGSGKKYKKCCWKADQTAADENS